MPCTYRLHCYSHGSNWIVKSFEPVGLSVVYVASQLMVPAESALSGVRVKKLVLLALA